MIDRARDSVSMLLVQPPVSGSSAGDRCRQCIPKFTSSILRVDAPFRRYAGILVDMFYDHFLARERPLASITRRMRQLPSSAISRSCSHCASCGTRSSSVRSSERSSPVSFRSNSSRASLIPGNASDYRRPANAFRSSSVEGVRWMQLNIRDRKRFNTWRAYLKPIVDHPRLTLVAGAHARRLLIREAEEHFGLFPP